MDRGGGRLVACSSSPPLRPPNWPPVVGLWPVFQSSTPVKLAMDRREFFRRRHTKKIATSITSTAIGPRTKAAINGCVPLPELACSVN